MGTHSNRIATAKFYTVIFLNNCHGDGDATFFKQLDRSLCQSVDKNSPLLGSQTFQFPRRLQFVMQVKCVCVCVCVCARVGA